MGFFDDSRANIAQGDPGLPGTGTLGSRQDQWGRSPGDPAYGDPAPPSNAKVSAPWDQGGDSSRGVDQELIDPRYLNDPAIAAARERDGLTSDPAQQQAKIDAAPTVRLGGGGLTGAANAVFGAGPSFQQGAQNYIGSGGNPNGATRLIAAGVDPKVATSGTGGTGGGGGADFTNPSQYGWGNFTQGAQQTAGFYADMAKWQMGQQAPTMGRTAIDWSGYGSGTQAAPPAAPYNPSMPSMPNSLGMTGDRVQRAVNAPGTATYPEDSMVSSPPPPGNGAGTTGGAPSSPTASGDGRSLIGVGPGMTSREGDMSGMFQPPPPRITPGSLPPEAANGGATAGLPRTMGQAGAQAQVSGTSAGGGTQFGTTQAPSATPQSVSRDTQAGQTDLGNRAAPTSVQNYPTGPAGPTGPGGIPSVGQYSNPLFQQGQQSRGAEGALLDRFSSPGMFKTGQEGAEAGSRQAQTDILSHTASPDAYKNAQQGADDASRAQQQNVMARTGSSSFYTNPEQSTQQQSRGQQQDLVSRLNSDLNGGAPSAAQAQLAAATQQSINAQASAAASAGPGNYALASRTAMQNAAQMQADASNKSAQLKAQEYAQARGELGTATSSARGQDLSNLGMSYQNTTAQGQLQAQQAQATRSADLQRLGMEYGNTTSQNQLLAQQAQALRGQDIQRLGQDYSNTLGQAQLASNQSQAMRSADQNATNTSYQNALAQAQFEQQQNASQAQLDAQQRQQNATMAAQYFGMENATMSNDLASRMHEQDLMAAKYANDRNLSAQQGQFQQQQNNLMMGTGLSTLGALGGAALMMSDERVKTEIEPASSGELGDFLGKLNPATFRYKNPKHGEGRTPGVMAQDVGKSRIGSLLVVETPGGKALHIPKTVGALLAAGAAHEKRLRKLEAGRQTIGAKRAA